MAEDSRDINGIRTDAMAVSVGDVKWERIPIGSVTVGEGRRALRNVEELAASIAEVGLLNPITVTEEHRLIAGYHRLEACRLLGWSEIDVIAVGLDEVDAELAEIDENLVRNDLTVLERAEHYHRRKRLYEAKNPDARHGVAGARARHDSANEIISLATAAAGKTGVSPRTVQQEVRIATQLDQSVRDAIRDTRVADCKTDLIALARRSPEDQRRIVEKLTNGTADGVQNAIRDLREDVREERRERNRQLVAATPTLGTSLGEAKFATITIDPPWSPADEGESGAGLYGRANPPYATMNFDAIRQLPVGTFADEDCHCYLWITNKSLFKGRELLEAWGFRYVTTLTWCKPHFGLGKYFRGSSEHVLFGVRGSQPLKRRDCGTWFEAPRGPDGHSSKPVEFYDLVESCSPGPFLEIFARGGREGWTSWGAEADPSTGTSA